ncbi:hypothetical protein PoB_005934100 [Plakobranchus ocellatus]|uniref:Uncharacterized protein n=1 Tax=Plakobranchus ocellatus TaxID=259542 RepID=A0AAV4CM16_9GAST|nr:hypothetical protein PoB_005934100 [Plakobranchus ocellatus]
MQTDKRQTTSDFSDFKEMAKSLFNLDLDEDRNRVKWMSIRSLALSSSEPDIAKIKYHCEREMVRMDINKRMKHSSGSFSKAKASEIEPQDAAPV